MATDREEGRLTSRIVAEIELRAVAGATFALLEASLHAALVEVAKDFNIPVADALLIARPYIEKLRAQTTADCLVSRQPPRTPNV